MLKEWVKEERPDDQELTERLEKARQALAVRQIQIKEKNLPVLVVIDGWGAAGKGSVLGCIIRNLDITKFRSNVDYIHHASAFNYTFTPILIRRINNLLYSIHI